ncbi:ArsR/SmtB family transcription factor [Nakamurella aerolata]|uniref:Winged helix-turn-helix transcriptional regulator n=1 Tax=Nakamurella aerolata TaxID=1656892 RepID=A0A849ADH6_9ACTN|nr:winged helix-turn-helix domain-containing protein [Nakamurella aerolata]NNG37261.1 winged helix-turn-helix transcriptional regulator [Nakamurella aerolata]
MSSINPETDPTPVDRPDYQLEDVRIISSTAELKALFHPLREELVDLLLERAATVAELADAVGRPPSTVAYHVAKLLDAGLIKVVRTRKVRAIDERWYGRVARTFYVGKISAEQLPLVPNYLPTAAAESVAAHRNDQLRALLRYAHIPEDQAEPFWRKMIALFAEFSALPRTGERSYALVAGLYPTEHVTLPPADDAAAHQRPGSGSGDHP